MKDFNDTLFLEMRGCDFWENDNINSYSDVENYRVGVYDDSIISRNNIAYSLEFTNYDRMNYRRTNKRTGKPLKKPVTELVKKYALHLDTYYHNEEGCWRDLKLEKAISDLMLGYTQADILTAVNYISVKQYENIVFLCDESIKHKLNKIYNLGGYREKSIIDDLKKVVWKQYTKNYHVVTFIDNSNNTFDYELLSGRISG